MRLLFKTRPSGHGDIYKKIYIWSSEKTIITENGIKLWQSTKPKTAKTRLKKLNHKTYFDTDETR